MDGLFDAEVVSEGPYESVDDVFGAAGVNVGSKVASVDCLNGVTSIFSASSMLVVDADWDNPVDGRIGYKVTLRTDGSYTTIMK